MSSRPPLHPLLTIFFWCQSFFCGFLVIAALLDLLIFAGLRGFPLGLVVLIVLVDLLAATFEVGNGLDVLLGSSAGAVHLDTPRVALMRSWITCWGVLDAAFVASFLVV